MNPCPSPLSALQRSPWYDNASPPPREKRQWSPPFEGAMHSHSCTPWGGFGAQISQSTLIHAAAPGNNKITASKCDCLGIHHVCHSRDWGGGEGLGGVQTHTASATLSEISRWLPPLHCWELILPGQEPLPIIKTFVPLVRGGSHSATEAGNTLCNPSTLSAKPSELGNRHSREQQH
uniref:Uncharacterized protein n=1 Tax=Eutreptiella gymnastica TaxID=73025 RepID=A0A7S1N2U3_9EUGL|mmetsp:Transcript_110959/g.192366  ORF Transcript_110959/g.192366 Transcript_110959/m.192366 type:complete len:177 (+) Transcript_110959:421-951(+)